MLAFQVLRDRVLYVGRGYFFFFYFESIGLVSIAYQYGRGVYREGFFRGFRICFFSGEGSFVFKYFFQAESGVFLFLFFTGQGWGLIVGFFFMWVWDMRLLESLSIWLSCFEGILSFVVVMYVLSMVLIFFILLNLGFSRSCRIRKQGYSIRSQFRSFRFRGGGGVFTFLFLIQRFFIFKDQWGYGFWVFCLFFSLLVFFDIFIWFFFFEE